jgi:hypothetical protein
MAKTLGEVATNSPRRIIGWKGRAGGDGEGQGSNECSRKYTIKTYLFYDHPAALPPRMFMCALKIYFLKSIIIFDPSSSRGDGEERGGERTMVRWPHE